MRSMMSVVWPKSRPRVKLRVVSALGLLVVSKIANVGVPFLFKYVIDSIENPVLLGSCVASVSTTSLIIAYGASKASASMFSELRNAIFASVTQQSIREIAGDLLNHLHHLDLSFHHKRQTGALMKAVDRGTRAISFVLNALVFNIVPLVFELCLVSYILMHSYGASYAIVALSTVGAYSLFTFFITQWRTQFRIEMNKADNVAGNLAVDSLLNFETVKLFNNEAYETHRYDLQLKRYQKASLKTQTSLALLNFGQNLIFSVGIASIMLLSANGLNEGVMSIGDMVAVNGLLIQLSFPLNFLGTVYREVRQSMIDMDAMFKLLEIKPSVSDRFDALPLILTKSDGTNEVNEAASILFDDVSFRYDDSDMDVLKNLSFEIKPQSKVAFVGPTGCGKSTIIKLLFRFYDPTAGQIYINGQNIRKVTLDSLRKYANIKYGDLTADDEQVYEAARAAAIHHKINNMSKGYETLVGERGLKLAGGEKQRIAIARALLKDAPIFIYDEATSNLDAWTESLIVRALRKISASIDRPRTSIFIAHRLSTVTDCDNIYVMGEGRIADSGLHEDLLRKNESFYKRMWETQKQ
ncbi:hypothetical protein ACOME3_010193 [Neoechinorhynchus agilis]